MAAGRWPARYVGWRVPFLARVAAALRPGVRVLDVGSGARPTVPPEHRPEGCIYVGLDVSAHEIQRAEEGSYDDVLVGDICTGLPARAGRFDLALSSHVLEHVSSMRAALAAQHAVLRPGGRMVAMLSGAWAFYALMGRILPYRASAALQARLLGTEAEDKFPTRYDGCTDRALRRILARGGWASWEIEPRYGGGVYLNFSRTLQRTYLAYENWAARAPRPNLATHYIVEAIA